MSLLQGLAEEIGAALTDAPHGAPDAFDSVEQAMQHLAAVACTGFPPLLVVLDREWEREDVHAIPLLTKVLVTTRDDSFVVVPASLVEIEVPEDEALELPPKSSAAACQPGNAVESQTIKVRKG